MKKMAAGALGGLAAVAAARPAAADEGASAGVLSAGYLFSAVAGRAGASAHGVEGSYVFYPDRTEPLGLGAFTQWQSYGGEEGRWAVGGQVNLAPFGLELGYARRERDDWHVATGGVHAAAFVSVALLHVAFRTTLLPDPPPGSYGPEYAFTLGIKLPFAAPGYPKWAVPELRIPSGRPLRVGGGERVASLKGARAWQADVRPGLAGLGPAERAERAERWARDGQAEHASVASFARLSLELMALGAPPELVEAAHRAALDEVRHARLCFALASAYAGGPLGAGELPVPPPRALGLAELARESFVDGCLGEAMAAALARDELRDCDDPELSAVLRIIARDEARHAKLGWQIVAWCLREGGPEVARALEAARASVGPPGGGGRKPSGPAGAANDAAGPAGEGREARCYTRTARTAGRRLRGLLGGPAQKPDSSCSISRLRS